MEVYKGASEGEEESRRCVTGGETASHGEAGVAGDRGRAAASGGPQRVYGTGRPLKSTMYAHGRTSVPGEKI